MYASPDMLGEEVTLEEAALMGAYDDSDLMGEIDSIADRIDLMGECMGEDILYNPELMGGFLKRIIGRIRSRVRARRAAKAARGEPAAPPPTFSAQTPYGSAKIGPQGFSYTGPQGTSMIPGPGGIPQIVPQQPVAQASAAGPMAMIQKNPMLLAIPLGLVVMSMMMNKKSAK